MYFNVHEDFGDRIVGYLVPESPSGHASIQIISDGRQIAVIACSRAMPGLEGLLLVGRRGEVDCWFIVDEAAVPGLHRMTNVELREAETGILVYRRAPEAQFVPKKLLRLETHMVRLRYVDQALQSRFCYNYLSAERWGLETTTQLFHLLNAESLYIAGRLLYRSSERIAEHFKMFCIVHDPFEELAERLLLFRHAARRGHLDMRDSITYAPVIQFTAELAWSSDRALRTAFRHIPEVAALPLQNPLLRQLTVTTPLDLPRNSAIPSALSTLASCEIVGLRSEGEQFASALSALLASDTKIVPTPPRCAAAIELADRLRQIPSVHDLLALDLELYESVAGAYHRAADKLSNHLSA